MVLAGLCVKFLLGKAGSHPWMNYKQRKQNEEITGIRGMIQSERKQKMQGAGLGGSSGVDLLRETVDIRRSICQE